MNKRKLYNYRSEFLFSDSNFWAGFGSVMNLAGNYFSFHSSNNEQQSDAKALESDWGVVGQHIVEATKKVQKTKQTAIQQELTFD